MALARHVDDASCSDRHGVGNDTFRLRAERSETGNGRVCTITYEARDACGHTTIAAATVTSTIVAVLAVMFPGLGIGETTTSHGLTPTDVFRQYRNRDVCSSGHHRHSIDHADGGQRLGDLDLLVYFTSKWSGMSTDTELLLTFRVNDGAGEVANTGFEWGLSNNGSLRAHQSGTLMWTFDGIEPGVYSVFADARTDPVPGRAGGGNTNNNPSAVMENCAMTVFVVPAAISPPTPSATQSPPSPSPPPSPPSVA
jgi:hypothetical protein